jgi:hypothetical protein
MPSDPLLVLTRIVQVLTTLEIPYLVGGSLASSAYGIPRATQDVDLVADLGDEHIGPLVAALREEFYVEESHVREAIEQGTSFNLIHLATMYKADVFLRHRVPWAAEEFARRRLAPIEADTSPVYLASPEDTILHKLHWFRLGGDASDRQWNDVLGVLKVQAQGLDLAYLRRQAGELEVSDLLDDALAEARTEELQT